MQNIPK